jgi:hypothetical protein
MAEKQSRSWTNCGGSAGNAVYGLGLIGALVYYVQAADGFWEGILGILKRPAGPSRPSTAGRSTLHGRKQRVDG